MGRIAFIATCTKMLEMLGSGGGGVRFSNLGLTTVQGMSVDLLTLSLSVELLGASKEEEEERSGRK